MKKWEIHMKNPEYNVGKLLSKCAYSQKWEIFPSWLFQKWEIKFQKWEFPQLNCEKMNTGQNPRCVCSALLHCAALRCGGDGGVEAFVSEWAAANDVAVK